VKAKRAVVLLIALLLASCSSGQSFYVVATNGDVNSMLHKIIVSADDAGFSPESGGATDDRGHRVDVLEGDRLGLKLWVQNLPRSAYEARACRSDPQRDAYSDQFLVSIDRFFPWFGSMSPQAASKRMQASLREASVEVLTQPRLCTGG
jgi:hypothetical protein